MTLERAMKRMKTLGRQTEEETAALRDTLLPMQRSLSDKLGKSMKEPMVQEWLAQRAKVKC